jgi:signal transduction histidine kinase
MRLRTKLLFAFLASPAFLFLQSVRASKQLRSIGADVDSLDRYTQTEDLRGQVILELLSLPDPQALAVDRARAKDFVHAERALVLCRSLETRTRETAAVARTEETIVEYLSALRDLEAAIRETGARASFQAEGRRARAAWEELVKVRGRGAPGGHDVPDALEPVAQEARRAGFQVARHTDELSSQVIATGLGLTLLLTLVTAAVLASVTAQPIVKLVRAARAVAHGDLDARVPVTGEDELSELSSAFNLMTERLRSVYQGLEATVQERTEALRRREADLARERKLAAVGRLAAGVAHEVANPLAVIAASAEGLRDRASEDAQLSAVPGFQDFPAYLETIENEAFRLKKLVRRLLDFSRGGGSEELRRERVDLASVVKDAVALASLDPRSKERPIETTLDPGTLELVGDADMLQEAVLNLLFNALDATETNRGTVSVAARRDGSHARVTVSDTGEGIEKENLDRLFEPFFTTKPPGKGTGLGLALAYRACERHSGRLVAASDGRGKGARFALELPLA